MNGKVRRAAERVVDGAGQLLGRRFLVRASRFVLDRARLDVRNDMASNGERWVIAEAIRHATSEPAEVLDVGAHIGDWTAEVLRACGTRSVRVHAFEPVPSLLMCLENRFKRDSRVVRHATAMGDRSCSTSMFVSPAGAGTSSIVAPEYWSEEITVGVTTLDEYCRNAGIGHVALVKSDTEGNDLAVARGAERLLGAKAIGLHQFEYNQRWISARTYLRDAFEWFEPFGYQLAKVTPMGAEFYPRWSYELETFKEANYLAVHPRLVPLLPTVSWWNAGP